MTAPDVDPMAARVEAVERALARLNPWAPLSVSQARRALAAGLPDDARAARGRVLGLYLPLGLYDARDTVAALLLDVAEGRQGWDA